MAGKRSGFRNLALPAPTPKGSMYPIIGVLGGLSIGIVVQALGKYMIIGYLDPEGKFLSVYGRTSRKMY